MNPAPGTRIVREMWGEVSFDLLPAVTLGLGTAEENKERTEGTGQETR